MSITREAIGEVERFLQKGEKLGAIKHLKDAYGLSLEESRILVETLEAKMSGVPLPRHATSRPGIQGHSREKLKSLLDSGNNIGAIKYIKDRFNLRLKDARDLVKEMEKSPPGLPTPKAFSPIRGAAGLALFIFAGLGMVFVIIAAAIFFNQTNAIANSDRVTGKVIRLKGQSGGGGSAPVIEYEWRGQKWLHASTVYTSPAAYSIDEEVPLFVNRKDPADITLDTFVDRWLVIMIFGLLGISFVLVPLLVFYLSMRR